MPNTASINRYGSNISSFLGNALQGDLGKSIVQKTDVIER